MAGAVAITLVRDAMSKMVSVVIGSGAGRQARRPPRLPMERAIALADRDHLAGRVARRHGISRGTIEIGPVQALAGDESREKEDDGQDGREALQHAPMIARTTRGARGKMTCLHATIRLSCSAFS